ncbi:hypothetical protein B2J88_02695 [Rhodococcus sp. SRB_17]|uniref:hypothetical protein n=1 Tax=Rhodococcus sp. OK302 TaxID=1882769 RepID=UPI000B93AEC4|nr:hypothetical protein [Rhodococcus sp. OK302]NMM83282.1 hypothetical protein [Rhodococcus sp. SRB_17]OYD70733.1 hypothetical protein BDB13_4370 [Rhodococcus sp. OK302]
MSENNTPRGRSTVEAAAYQATKHARVITDADLAAVVEGLTGESVPPTRVDISFPDPDDTRGLFG